MRDGPTPPSIAPDPQGTGQYDQDSVQVLCWCAGRSVVGSVVSVRVHVHVRARVHVRVRVRELELELTRARELKCECRCTCERTADRGCE